MISYQEAKAKVFAHGTIPCGYFGERASVGFALHKGRILAVADSGYFGYGADRLPTVIDEAEALWILQNHHSARDITIAR